MTAARAALLSGGAMLLRSAVLCAQAALPAQGLRGTTPDWTGLHIGTDVDYRTGSTATTVGPRAFPGQTFGSLYGGVSAGYDRSLTARFIVGAEITFVAPNFLEDGVAARDLPAQDTITTRVDVLGAVRGRVGYGTGRMLVYVGAGFAAAVTRVDQALGTGTTDRFLLHPGWSIATGLAVAIAPRWSIGAQYASEELAPARTTFLSGATYRSAFSVRALRLGLTYWLHTRAPHVAANDPPVSPAAGPTRWNAHEQFTVVEQGYPPIRSPYQGRNSLPGGGQGRNTVSATDFIGLRPWSSQHTSTELYLDPELMQGFGLHGTFGIAGFPNGEAQKAGFLLPRFNIARAFLRETIGLGGMQEHVDDGANQLPLTEDVSRVVLTAGKFAVPDIFDQNSYADDPRTNFLNWNIYGAGAYDWTMDQISWTWGVAAELHEPRWAGRLGYFLVPTVSSTNTFDMHIPARGEYTAEGEWRYALLAEPGALRVFAWVNRAVAGSYAASVALTKTNPGPADIAATRRARSNPGLVVDAEQAVSKDLGLFSRASWDGGQTEKIGGTDCDRSLALGMSLKGRPWGRSTDALGVAGVIDELSPEARAFFAAGGLGILIGDGQLSYKPERIAETYYAYAMTRWLTFSLDYQFVVAPAYNAARGPVSVFGARLHTEF